MILNVTLVTQSLKCKTQPRYHAPLVVTQWNGYGRQGAPDFLVCLEGKFFGIETKAGKGKLTLLQEMNLKKIIEAGGVALVVREEDVKYLPSLLTTGESKHEKAISS